MAALFHSCGATLSYRLVLDDDGCPAVLFWCPRCDRALSLEDDGWPPPIALADLPPELVSAMILLAAKCDGPPS